MSKIGSTGLILAVLVALTACDGDIVYRDTDPFVEPPDGGGEFLGYSDVDTKKTTCGNCHAGKQAEWSGTAHAGAWATLGASGAQQDFCEACHTVSPNGNLAAAGTGWVGTKNDRYQDVQCESCHGPGLLHVMNPDANDSKPLASIAVSTDMSSGCAECHSGSHRPFAEEWAESRHARVDEHRSTNASCVGCHEATEILKGWGVESTFLEESGTDHMAVTCAVCHDPHDAEHTGQLRFAMDVPDVEQNLCMKCHHKRGQPDPSTFRGPHSPEGPLLLGEAGWVPPSFDMPAGGIIGSHGSDRNPRLCATCHVNDYQFTDPLTGSFTARATGHSFQAIPCADANGIPTGSKDCELTQRSFRACVVCHLSEDAARSALTVAEMRLERLADEVAGLIARVAVSELDPNDGVYTTAEGSRFNMELARKAGTAVHNPFLVETLLLASIHQIELDYQLRPSSTLSLEAELTPH